jgi:hypothetical protein
MIDTPDTLARVRSAVTSGLSTGFKTMLFLVKIMVPVSLAVSLLQWTGVLAILARFLAPGMNLLGLSGESALVLVSAILLNNYSAIAVMESLPLTMREVTILAIMALTAHNLIVETAVMKKTSSSAFKMVVLRLGWAIAAGFVFNLILPADKSIFSSVDVTTAARPELISMLVAWAYSTIRLVLKVIFLVLGIMVIQRLMEEFRIMDVLSRPMVPLMRFFGLPESASFLWIVLNIVGYAYGAAIIMERVKDGKMKPQEADLFNHHAALCHSLFEDTVLYAAIGTPLVWITIPRLLMAFIVVWFERFRRQRFRKSFRAGTF